MSRKSPESEKGQTLVEFAVVALFFITLLFGIIEFGRALWTWNTIVHSTRTGARFAALQAPSSDDAAIKKFIVYGDPNANGTSKPVVPGLAETHVVVRYLNDDGTVAGTKVLADVIEVSITGYQFNFLVPLLGSSLALPAFRTTLPLEGMGAV